MMTVLEGITTKADELIEQATANTGPIEAKARMTNQV